VVPRHVQDVAILLRERLEHPLQVRVAGEHQNVDAGGVQLANEPRPAVGVHLEMEVRKDLELHGDIRGPRYLT
jgi:hypothetical protein